MWLVHSHFMVVQILSEMFLLSGDEYLSLSRAGEGIALKCKASKSNCVRRCRTSYLPFNIDYPFCSHYRSTLKPSPPLDPHFNKKKGRGGEEPWRDIPTGTPPPSFLSLIKSYGRLRKIWALDLFRRCLCDTIGLPSLL